MSSAQGGSAFHLTLNRVIVAWPHCCTEQTNNFQFSQFNPETIPFQLFPKLWQQSTFPKYSILNFYGSKTLARKGHNGIFQFQSAIRCLDPCERFLNGWMNRNQAIVLAWSLTFNCSANPNPNPFPGRTGLDRV